MLTARKYRNRASKLVILSIGSWRAGNAFRSPGSARDWRGSTLIQSAERKVRIQLSALSPYQKNTRDSAIIGDERNAFCPRFCPRRKAIKDPGWCGLDAPGQQFIHPSPANLAVATGAGQRLRKPCRNPGHLRYPRLHPAGSQAARQGRARAPQSTMPKVGKSHSKGTFAEVFGNDEDAPDSGPSRPRPGTERFDAKEPIAPTSDRTPTESAKEHEKCRSQR